ncbi:PREDICTED: transportin-3-like [Priapulus caudatus]|uniref:Transportin-3-like n=1 Tax=Priapulus caudatus TaxID=37621 RepID=A0ABM1ENV5_PRICU|nr:PREDICTED: transportin-3-like [Priapulus caudatus]
MEAAPSLETVTQAIQTLYHNPDVTAKERASFWLGELQKSVYAWEISDHLLHIRDADLESCYFAAQTMRTKVQYCFHELPQAAHQSLRDSLLEHINNVSESTNHIIVTQLCLAIVDLALQMVTWKNAAHELIQRFGGNPHHVPLLLDILKFLPEEVNSRSLRLGDNRRKEITEELSKSAPLVLQLLTSYMESAPGEVEFRRQTGVLKCLGSWFNLGSIPTDQVAHSKLIAGIFEALREPQISGSYHEAACDCLCAALFAVEEVDKHQALSQVLFEGVLTLPDAYLASVGEEDLDKSMNYCRIFTEMAESFLDCVIMTPNQGLGDLRTLDLLLMCISHHQYEVSEITFNFWYRLSEVLATKNDVNKEALFKPYIERLLTSLCQHSCMEPDEEDIPDDSDDFGHFRVQVSELIKDVIFLVGSANCFTQMYESLASQSSSTTWDRTEAALFVMTAVAKNISPSENVIVPQVLQALLNLPEDSHVAVKYTGTRLVGELCEWIDSHHEVLDSVLHFLLAGLHNHKIAPAAAAALLQICQICRDKMYQHFGGLVQIIQNVDSFNISNEAAVDLLKGTAMILSKMPLEKITEGAQQICAVQVNQLNEVLQHAGDTNMKLDPVIWLDRLAAVFRNLHPLVSDGQVHPCKPVIEAIWPLLSDCCDKYQHDIRVVERCCRCVRFSVRCVGKGADTILPPLVQQMVQLYSVHNHSCFLYLGSILVDEFGSEEGCQQGLLDMLQAFSVPTFKLLEEPDGFRNHPDTVDDLFRLCTRFVQRMPLMFIQASFFKSIINCGMAACMVDHRDANASVMKFLQDLLKIGMVNEDKYPDHAQRKQAAEAIMQEYGPQMLQNLLTAVIFCLPSFMMPDIADVVYAIMLIDRPSVCRFLEAALKALPVEGSGGVVRATHKQLVDFHKAVTSAEHAKQVSFALRDFTRLFR